ncbi:hypothetical protein HMPREF1570_0006 [Klebsiella oxytoca KA-2]|nr:hypothetical protein HMPREF1570_0006 [Klebsiella oxytoca KA-2]
MYGQKLFSQSCPHPARCAKRAAKHKSDQSLREFSHHSEFHR